MTKLWVWSNTVQGAVVMFLTSLVAWVAKFTEDGGIRTSTAIELGLLLIGFALTIYGRINANKPLSFKHYNYEAEKRQG